MSFLKKLKSLHWFFWPFLLLGVASVIVFIYLLGKSIQTEFWNKTEAELVSVDIIKSTRSRGRSNSKVVLQYGYTINGNKYVNDNLCVGYGFSSFEDHTGIYEVLKKAKRITIYVNPSDYEESYVVPGINETVLFFLTFSLVFNSLLSIFIVPFFLKEKKEPNEVFNLK